MTGRGPGEGLLPPKRVIVPRAFSTSLTPNSSYIEPLIGDPFHQSSNVTVGYSMTREYSAQPLSSEDIRGMIEGLT